MAARAVFDVKDDVKPEMKANYTQYVKPELESIPLDHNIKVENAFVKAESVDGGRSIKRTASAAENDSDGEIEYLGEAPAKKKVVELVDLTLD
ncbi:hypothetical protein HDU99_001345 [Rhizoclosmatium hyalinum]|nr:hypothetical protein HDU99_001345 [Rhizoclosmatium hyalinum]